MGSLTFVDYDGEKHHVDLDPDTSLMRHAVDNLVPGIDADCGGEAACGTCHVIVDDGWVAATGAPNEEEEQMLELNPERCSASRLSCQITVTEAMDGLVVHVPEFQM